MTLAELPEAPARPRPVSPASLRAVRAARRAGGRRAVAVSAALAAATALAACVSLSLGDFPVPLGDVVGRVVVSPAELQVGIVTAVIGGPVFVALVRRRRLAEL